MNGQDKDRTPKKPNVGAFGASGISKAIQHLAARLPSMPESVQSAARRVLQSMKRDESPSIEDISLCMLYFVEEDRKRGAIVKPKPLPRSSPSEEKQILPQRDGRPVSPFRGGLEESREEELEKKRRRILGIGQRSKE